MLLPWPFLALLLFNLNELSVSNHGWVFNNAGTLQVGIERTISVKKLSRIRIYQAVVRIVCSHDCVGFNPTLDWVDDDYRYKTYPGLCNRSRLITLVNTTLYPFTFWLISHVNLSTAGCCQNTFSADLFREYHQSAKQLGSRSGPTLDRAWSGSKLFANVITRRQKLSLAVKEWNVHALDQVYCQPWFQEKTGDFRLSLADWHGVTTTEHISADNIDQCLSDRINLLAISVHTSAMENQVRMT